MRAAPSNPRSLAQVAPPSRSKLALFFCSVSQNPFFPVIDPRGNEIFAKGEKKDNTPLASASVKTPLTSLKPPLTNSIGMKFVWISAWQLHDGQSEGRRRKAADDEIQHKVTLTKGFYMGVYTVTQEQWQEVMGKNPSNFKGEKNLPVESVSWDDCQEFIKKLREEGQEALSSAHRG